MNFENFNVSESTILKAINEQLKYSYKGVTFRSYSEDDENIKDKR